MLKKLTLLFAVVLITASLSNAQWRYDGPWPDNTRKGGTHGLEVAPDGKIWQASYYKTIWNGKSVSPILVYYPDGSKVDTIFTVTTGSITDTLGLGGSTSGTRGLAKDEKGNMLFISSGPNKMIKIDYKTYQGLGRYLISTTASEIGSSPAGPAVSENGTVFLGPVVGNGAATAKIAMFDKDFNYFGSAVTAPPDIARTFEVSKDGNTIYWTKFTGKMGILVYERPSEFDFFTAKDSIVYGMSIESAAWHPKSGLLYVSNDSRGTDKKYTHLTWYGINVATKALADSFTLPSPITPVAADELPRAIAFSADGNVAYVGLFGTAFDRIYKFTKVGTSVEKLDEIPTGYQLSQNYPNPFNPTTNIKFSLPESGFATLKVYNTLGQEVATLVNEFKHAGTYEVDFNAKDLSSGMYLYTLTTGKATISKKMLLVK